MGKQGGFITLQKQILSWEWYKVSSTKDLFIHLLLIANFADTAFKDTTIKRGQVVRSLTTLSTETGLSIQQVRTALDHLKLTGEITIQSCRRYHVITVVKYDDYQKLTERATASQQETNKTSNSESTRSPNENQQRNNNINNIYNKQTINTTVREALDETFAQFWEEYPRKEAKQNAKAAWNKLKPGPLEFGDIMNGLSAWKKSDQWSRDGGRYIPLPASWLNGKRWEDEVSVTVQYGNQNQSSGYPAKKNSFDNFEQRDYSGVDQEMMNDLAAKIRKAKEEGII